MNNERFIPSSSQKGKKQKESDHQKLIQFLNNSSQLHNNIYCSYCSKSVSPSSPSAESSSSSSSGNSQSYICSSKSINSIKLSDICQFKTGYYKRVEGEINAEKTENGPDSSLEGTKVDYLSG